MSPPRGAMAHPTFYLIGTDAPLWVQPGLHGGQPNGFGLQCLLSQLAWDGAACGPAHWPDHAPTAVQELGAKSIYSQHSGVVEVSSKPVQ